MISINETLILRIFSREFLVFFLINIAGNDFQMMFWLFRYQDRLFNQFALGDLLDKCRLDLSYFEK